MELHLLILKKRHLALLTAAQAKEIWDTPSKIKKFEEDATAAIQVVKDHISSHMQEEFSPIWDWVATLHGHTWPVAKRLRHQGPQSER